MKRSLFATKLEGSCILWRSCPSIVWTEKKTGVSAHIWTADLPNTIRRSHRL